MFKTRVTVYACFKMWTAKNVHHWKDTQIMRAQTNMATLSTTTNQMCTFVFNVWDESSVVPASNYYGMGWKNEVSILLNMEGNPQNVGCNSGQNEEPSPSPHPLHLAVSTSCFSLDCWHTLLPREILQCSYSWWYIVLREAHISSGQAHLYTVWKIDGVWSAIWCYGRLLSPPGVPGCLIKTLLWEINRFLIRTLVLLPKSIRMELYGADLPATFSSLDENDSFRLYF